MYLFNVCDRWTKNTLSLESAQGVSSVPRTLNLPNYLKIGNKFLAITSGPLCEALSINVFAFVDAIKAMRPKCGHFSHHLIFHITRFHSTLLHISLQWVWFFHRINSSTGNTHCSSWRLVIFQKPQFLSLSLSQSLYPSVWPIEWKLLNFYIIENPCLVLILLRYAALHLTEHEVTTTTTKQIKRINRIRVFSSSKSY